jgi:hypothetical protein
MESLTPPEVALLIGSTETTSSLLTVLIKKKLSAFATHFLLPSPLRTSGLRFNFANKSTEPKGAAPSAVGDV